LLLFFFSKSKQLKRCIEPTSEWAFTPTGLDLTALVWHCSFEMPQWSRRSGCDRMRSYRHSFIWSFIFPSFVCRSVFFHSILLDICFWYKIKKYAVLVSDNGTNSNLVIPFYYTQFTRVHFDNPTNISRALNILVWWTRWNG